MCAKDYLDRYAHLETHQLLDTITEPVQSKWYSEPEYRLTCLLTALSEKRHQDENFDFKPIIESFFSYYGIPDQLPELILKADIKGDFKLSEVLNKYL